MLFRWGIFVLFGCGCAAQNFSIGFEGGGALTNAYETLNTGVPETLTSWSQAKDYVVGLTLEYRLRGHLSFESDVIYREQHLTVAFVEPNLVLNSVSPSPVVTWELPFMAKYRFHWAGLHGAEPFLEGGPALRPTSNLNANPSHYGVTAGFGVATHWHGFEITPAIRYSHWATDGRIVTAIAKGDQIELIAGISNHPRSAWHPLSSRIQLGVVAGMTLLHDVPSSTTPLERVTEMVSGNYAFLMGPALEAVLPWRMFLELNAYYHQIDVTERSVLSNGSLFGAYSGREAATWEFPVLLKHKFAAERPVRPFVDAGPSFRLLAENSSVVGITAGAGIETRLLRSLKIAPGVRFTHWGPQGRHSPSTEMIVNQLEFLTGFLL